MAGLKHAMILVPVAAALIAACGGSEPEPQTQFQAGGQVPQQGMPQQGVPQQGVPQQGVPQQGVPQQGVPQQPVPVQPAATATVPSLPGLPPNAQVGSPAQPLDASAGVAAQPILNQLAATQAPGARPLGASVVGMFQAGQQLETVVQMSPGKCYTVIAVGLPAVSEVNIQLVAATPVPGMSPVLAQDQTAGVHAVLGQSPNCFKWALPVAASVKVVTTVAAGQGIAAVQVYEK